MTLRDLGMALAMWSTIVVLPLAPAPTNPLCYDSPAYRDTHEQECIVDLIHAPGNDNQPGQPGGPGSGGDHGGGGLGGLLGGLTGGLL